MLLKKFSKKCPAAGTVCKYLIRQHTVGHLAGLISGLKKVLFHKYYGRQALQLVAESYISHITALLRAAFFTELPSEWMPV